MTGDSREDIFKDTGARCGRNEGRSLPRGPGRDSREDVLKDVGENVDIKLDVSDNAGYSGDSMGGRAWGRSDGAKGRRWGRDRHMLIHNV